MQKEIIARKDQLPGTIPDLIKLIFIGEGAIASYKA